MNTEISISKIVLKLKDSSIELTPDEARKLRDELNALLGERVSVPYPIYVDRWHNPNPVTPIQPWQPIWVGTSPSYRMGDLTCHATS